MANKVFLVGRTTKDVLAREIARAVGEYADKNPSLVARFTLAVDRRFKAEGSDQKADFINCVAFGKTADFASKYLKKGTKIVVVGRIQTGSYTNKDGQKVYTTDVVAEEIEFAESKSSAAASSAAPAAAPAPAPAPAPVAAAPNPLEGFMDGVEVENLPFN